MSPAASHDEEARLWVVLGSVPDPEIPAVNIVELGMVRAVNSQAVTLTTTYIGCPATDVIFADVRAALDADGFEGVALRITQSPPWTTDWITDAAKEKLRKYGIAPPRPRANNDHAPNCPRCGAGEAILVSEFGSTPCKSHYKCTACLEPFDAFKCH